MTEKCEFKKKPCPYRISVTIGGQKQEGTTWEFIRRLSNRGNKEGIGEFIDTRRIGDNYTFKQTDPRNVAEMYSSKKLGPFEVHPCGNCTVRITRVLDRLGLQPERKISPKTLE